MFISVTKRQSPPELYKIYNNPAVKDSPVAEEFFNYICSGEDIRLYGHSVIKVAGFFIIYEHTAQIDYHGSEVLPDRIKSIINSNAELLKGYKWYFNTDGVIMAAENLLTEGLMITPSAIQKMLESEKSIPVITPFLEGKIADKYLELIKAIYETGISCLLETPDQTFLMTKPAIPYILFSQSHTSMIKQIKEERNGKDYEVEKLFWYYLLISSPDIFKSLEGYPFPEMYNIELFCKVCESEIPKKWAH